MAFFRTFKSAPGTEPGFIAVTDARTENGEQFIGIKMVEREDISKPQVVFMLDRAETLVLVRMLQATLDKEVPRVH